MREVVPDLWQFHDPFWVGGAHHHAYFAQYSMAGQIAAGGHAAAADAAAGDGATNRRIWQPWFDDDDERKNRPNSAPSSSTSSSSLSSTAPEPQRSSTYSAKHLPTKSRKEQRKADRGLLETRPRHPSAPPPPYSLPKHEVVVVNGHKSVDCVKELRGGHERMDDPIGIEEDEDYEAPLDMTTQARRKSPTPLSRLSGYPLPPPRPPSYSTHLPRPSVITCLSENGTNDRATTTSGQLRTGRRDTTSPGVCDSVIDEHFRRSLGDRYTHLFASSGSSSEGETSKSPARPGQTSSPNLNVTGLSVDDHFAKALGDTWFKLQQTQPKDSEGEAINRTTTAGLLFSA